MALTNADIENIESLNQWVTKLKSGDLAEENKSPSTIKGREILASIADIFGDTYEPKEKGGF
jgi:hypothetical protein